jgi:hypothetical protein
LTRSASSPIVTSSVEPMLKTSPDRPGMIHQLEQRPDHVGDVAKQRVCVPSP